MFVLLFKILKIMNVLILTDLSDVAKNAGSYAVKFLADVPVHFYLLNIEFASCALGTGFVAGKKQEAVKKLNRRIKELQQISPGKAHQFFAIYSEDDLITAARKYVEEKKIDLIVMGAALKGHSPNTVIGNHTYEVIQKIKCNILAVAENSIYIRPERMIFPIDNPALLNKDILKFLKRRGIAEDADLTIMEVIKDVSEISTGSSMFSPNDWGVRKVEVKQIASAEAYSEEKLLEVQKKFNLIILLARNIGICDKLLHNRHGIYSIVANNLPILVLHK